MNQSENAIYVNLLRDIANLLKDEYVAAYAKNTRLHTHALDIQGNNKVVCIISTNPSRIIELATMKGLYGAHIFQLPNDEHAVFWPHPVFSDELYSNYGEGVDPN